MKKRLRSNLRIEVLGRIIVWAPAFGLLLFLGACNPKSETQVTDTYTCPMHPTVVSDKQGVCPVCNMDLVRKARPGEEVKVTEDLARLIKSPNESVVATSKTIRGEFKAVGSENSAPGVVTYDTRQISTLAARVTGRLEAVNLKYFFQPVRKGQPVATIYSPQLVALQQELFYLLNNDATNSKLIEGTKNKLVLAGLTEAQVSQLIQSRELQYRIIIYSPVDGYLISDDPAPRVSPTVKQVGMGMATEISNQAAPVPVQIKEGDYVIEGQVLFRIVNKNSIRVELDLTPTQSRTIKLGTPLEVRTSTATIRAKIDFIQPFYSNDDEFVKLRAYTSGSDLKIGTLVTGHWNSSSSESLWLPRSAVLDLGTQHVVFVKERGAFIPKPITIKSRLNGEWEVLGLSSSDEVAVQAHFLVDSEGFVKLKN